MPDLSWLACMRKRVQTPFVGRISWHSYKQESGCPLRHKHTPPFNLAACSLPRETSFLWQMPLWCWKPVWHPCLVGKPGFGGVISWLACLGGWWLEFSPRVWARRVPGICRWLCGPVAWLVPCQAAGTHLAGRQGRSLATSGSPASCSKVGWCLTQSRLFCSCLVDVFIAVWNGARYRSWLRLCCEEILWSC